MIPQAADTVEVSSNINGETGQFTVDENSLAKIMSVLTNLYSDPEGAVVREYLTNALDAQIEAQESDPGYVWRPIEVTTPSRWSKEYKVRDFGPGMTVDDIKEVYSKYGKSTKESSNAVTGMLGLGSKCALTYTGQFTIVGYKNGVMTKAIVSKDENDIPIFMIVDTSSTTEPNGVEISVPVRDVNSFAEKTQKFLRWWKPGQVIVDGKEPASHGHKLVNSTPMEFTINGTKVTAPVEVYLIEKEGYRYEQPQSYIVMGNVPYQVDAEYVDEGLRNAYLGFVAYVPMGAVDFPPSREKLFYNNRTKQAVRTVSTGLFELILDEKLREVTDAPDHKTAYAKWARLPQHFANTSKAKTLTYKGLAFITKTQHDHMVLDWDWQGHGQIAERQWINMNSIMQGALIVTGVTQGAKPTSYFKKKVKHYMSENSIDGDAYLVDSDVTDAWLAWVPRIDAEHIKSIKLPRDGGANAPRVEAPYDYYMWNSATGRADCESSLVVPVPAGKTLIYISPQDMKETYRKSGTSAEAVVKALGDKYILVVLGKNRFEKFKRTHSSALPAKDAFQKRIDELVASANDAEFIYGQLGYGEQQFLKKVDITKILDPDLVDLAKVAQTKNMTSHYDLARTVHDLARRASAVTTLPEKKKVSVNAAKRYALIEHCGSRNMSHLLVYVNALWEQEYKPKP